MIEWLHGSNREYGKYPHVSFIPMGSTIYMIDWRQCNDDYEYDYLRESFLEQMRTLDSVAANG